MRFATLNVSGPSAARAGRLLDFLPSLEADVLVLTDIYAASEPPIPGITSEALATAIREAGHKNVFYFRSMQESIEYLLREGRPLDAILTIGAGNVSRASNELMVLLGTEYPAHHAH